VEILQAGYRIGDRVLRPARVAVAEPGPDEVAEEAGDEQETPAAQTDEAAPATDPTPDDTPSVEDSTQK
jgi:molecular chaperone GrpE